MLNPLYRQQDFPVFQNRMYDNAMEAKNCPKGDIELVEDLETGLVYNAAFCPELLTYDDHYQNEQAVSPLFQKHLESVVELVGAHLGRVQLVEVGCGKGHFLEMLLARGFDITGFDPAYEGSNERIKRQYFAPGVMDRARGLILRHVLEHVQHPVDFLGRLRDANGGSGRVYIEVPCFDWICEHRAWYDVFYEHVNYFRLSDFDRIFDGVVDSGRIFGGQYLYVLGDLSTLRDPRLDATDRVKFPADFTRDLAAENGPQGGCTAIWGGASKGVIFSLLKARAGQPVSIVIDINPAKQGRYLGGTGLQVKSPAEAMAQLPEGATVYVMNPNYLDEIKQMSEGAFNLIGIESP